MELQKTTTPDMERKVCIRKEGPVLIKLTLFLLEGVVVITESNRITPICFVLLSTFDFLVNKS
jgi:hypothetical protein